MVKQPTEESENSLVLQALVSAFPTSNHSFIYQFSQLFTKCPCPKKIYPSSNFILKPTKISDYSINITFASHEFLYFLEINNNIMKLKNNSALKGDKH